jgi:hypothetical protein
VLVILVLVALHHPLHCVLLSCLTLILVVVGVCVPVHVHVRVRERAGYIAATSRPPPPRLCVGGVNCKPPIY